MSYEDRSYYYRIRGRTTGPFDIRKMQQAVARGQVNRNTDVSADGMTWGKAAEFPEIFQRAAGPAPGLLTGGGLTVVDRWYYVSNGQSIEANLADLQQMVARGSLGRSDHVIRHGMASWATIDSLPELRSYLPPDRAVGPVPGGGNGVGTGGGGGGFAGADGVFCRECGERLNRRAVICPKCGVPTDTDEGTGVNRRKKKSGEPKSRVVAAVLAFFLGGLGMHHFYLGNIVAGILYLVFCWTFIPAFVSFIEGIIYLCTSDEKFAEQYG